MALAAYQEILARLYTDSQYRKSFFNDRAKAFHDYDLNANEKHQLLALSQDQVEDFALSLVRKRMHEVRDQLPYTAKKMGSEFGRLFIAYADKYLPSGVNKHTDDAISFGSYLIDHLKRNSSNSDSVEIARFETNRVRRLLSQKKLIIEKYNFPVASLVQSIAVNTASPVLRREIHVYFRSSMDKSFKQWRFYI